MEDDDLETLILLQKQELMATRTTESDLDLDLDLDLASAFAFSFSFWLQMQEAMAASLALQPSSSTSPPLPLSPNNDHELSNLISLQTLELDRFHQEKQDTLISQSETKRIAADLRRRSHDERLAIEVDQMDDQDWEEFGDNFERPMEEERTVRVYFKGMDVKEVVKGSNDQLAGIGVAVCDGRDRLVLKISKALAGVGNKEALETRALIEGLNAVVGLGIRKADVFFHFRPLYNHVTGRWMAKQRKIANLINQVKLVQKKLDQCNMFLVTRCHVKFAFKLARDAIDSQMKKNLELNGKKDLKEACKICLEDTDLSHMFVVDECLHRFCFSCMKQHVEVKLLHGLLPGCPHEGCRIRLIVESCRNFLTPKLLNIMIQRLKEESIPVTQKIYCPYPKCSALMSTSEAIRPQQGSSKQPAHGTSGLRKCIKCSGSFCIKCKVPWHDRMSCYDYKRLNPQNHAEESKLRALARQNLWRQCVKCNHMIELAEGCFHMTCRCGYEFCYTCGAEWRNRKATCSCPLWDEENILYDDTDEDFDDYFGDEAYDDFDAFVNFEEDAFYHRLLRIAAGK